MFFEHGQYSDPTSMAHNQPSDGNTRPEAAERDRNGDFDRNKFRKTLPSNSRYKAISPAERNWKKRPATPSKSPTQSHVSTATNYATPWTSPKFQTPTPMKKGAPGEEELRFRRTHSVAVRKAEDDQRGDNRPLINYKEVGTFRNIRNSIANKFKKNGAKKTPIPDKSRMSAPVIKLGETSTSQPQLPTTSTAAVAAAAPTTSPKKVIRASCSLKMQPEDRKKMFQKMGREQTMKENNLQRMQRERQRDFALIPASGRLEASTLSVTNSMNSIDSMMVFSTPSRRSESLSLIDDDVEPVFKNSLTKRNVTSSQVASMKTQEKNQNQKLVSGPSFTSTPRLAGTIADSPTISNVRSVSESSFCLVSSNEATPAPTRPMMNAMNDTMYFSTVAIPNPGRITPSVPIPIGNFPPRSLNNFSMPSTSTTPTPNTAGFTVKQEVVDPQESRSSSHCPSIASTSTPPNDFEAQRQALLQPAHPDQLNDLWMVSKAIRDKQLSYDHFFPKIAQLQPLIEAMEKERNDLLNTKMDSPNHDDMRELWKLSRDYQKLNNEYIIANMSVQDARLWIPQFEARRNQLLSQSPPAINVPASFV